MPSRALSSERIQTMKDTTQNLNGNWVQQLYQCNFRINDPRIRYPKFPNFCRIVYNWGDKTFNRYDSLYVKGTGLNWKAYYNITNWHQSYAYIIGNNPIVLKTNFNSEIGVNLTFMAVNIGYTWNLNRLFSNSNNQSKQFNFSFTCALFSAEILKWNITGDTFLTKFGQYKNRDGSNLDIPIDDMTHDAIDIKAYYFFNNKRFSAGAAYNYSKYQLKSTGSWLLGVNIGRHKISMDFSGLPEDMLADIPEFRQTYKFNYIDYAILGGYSYNAVMPHNWIYNITMTPSVGYKRTSLRSDVISKHNDNRNMISINYHGKMALTYNHRKMFLSAIIRFDGGCYFDRDYTFFNLMNNATFNMGIRF